MDGLVNKGRYSESGLAEFEYIEAQALVIDLERKVAYGVALIPYYTIDKLDESRTLTQETYNLLTSEISLEGKTLDEYLGNLKATGKEPFEKPFSVLVGSINGIEDVASRIAESYIAQEKLAPDELDEADMIFMTDEAIAYFDRHRNSGRIIFAYDEGIDEAIFSFGFSKLEELYKPAKVIAVEYAN
ncbi:MAG: hypothetical protein HGA85_05875 [Nanoarchaeota archaeon]|nr:hypothetical protein [Nanoarchaeota archaeon]